jgi:hypothetical protein
MSIAVEEAARGARIIWGAPTFDQVRVGWTEGRRAARTAAHWNSTRMAAEFPSGGLIVYRSLDDPDNARGHSADGVVVDESGDVQEAAWYEVLRPMLIDTGGWAWCIGTPKGRNWFWREWHEATDRDDSMAWQVPTLGVEITANGLVRRPHPLENPLISFDEIQHVYRSLPELTFRQEILAEFVESSGTVFRRVREAAVAEPQDKPIEGHAYLISVDWGKHQDWTVLAVWDATLGELVALDRFQQIDYQLQIGRLGTLCERFRPFALVPERNSMGEPLIEQVARAAWCPPAILPFTTTNASKALAVESFALALEQGAVKVLDDPVLVGELQAYEAKRLPSGMLRYGAPAGMHDDCVIATVTGWHALSGGFVGEAVMTYDEPVSISAV